MSTTHILRPMPPFRTFASHVARNAAIAGAIVAVSLGGGAWGYHFFEGLSWLDAVLNASMILTGMGPVDRPVTSGGKLFATGYALYSGLAFLSTAAILFTPVARRALHRLHLDMHR